MPAMPWRIARYCPRLCRIGRSVTLIDIHPCRWQADQLAEALLHGTLQLDKKYRRFGS